MYFKFISRKGKKCAYFKAVLSNTKEKTKVVSKRKFFQSKKYATTNSPEAAWKYEYLSAYLAQ